jgi:hypothetical protein
MNGAGVQAREPGCQLLILSGVDLVVAALGAVPEVGGVLHLANDNYSLEVPKNDCRRTFHRHARLGVVRYRS